MRPGPGPGHTRHGAGHQGPGVRPGVGGGPVTDVNVTDKPVEGVRLPVPGLDRRPGGGPDGGPATRGAGHLPTHCPLPPEPGAKLVRLWSGKHFSDIVLVNSQEWESK